MNIQPLTVVSGFILTFGLLLGLMLALSSRLDTGAGHYRLLGISALEIAGTLALVFLIPQPIMLQICFGTGMILGGVATLYEVHTHPTESWSLPPMNGKPTYRKRLINKRQNLLI